HYVFLGACEYDLATGPGLVLTARAETALGLLRLRPGPRVRRLDAAAGEVAAQARAPRVLNLTKTNAISPVHRAAHMDYVGVKRFDDAGAVVGERRFIGLYTADALTGGARSSPLGRRRLEAVLRRAGFEPGAHNASALAAALERLPREDLFAGSVEELTALALSIMRLANRREVGLFVRRDRFGRFLRVFVHIPRDRYTTKVRLAIQDLLAEAFGGGEIEYATQVGEQSHAQLVYTIWTSSPLPAPQELAALRLRLADIVRDWDDALEAELAASLGEEEGRMRRRRWGRAFGPAYTDQHSAAAAVLDIERLEALAARGGPDGRPAPQLDAVLHRPLGAALGEQRVALYRSGPPITLSTVLPMLQNLGLEVIDEQPHEVLPADSEPLWIYDIGVRVPPAEGDGEPADLRDRLQDAFLAVWRGDAENDELNALVTTAGLTWREAALVRSLVRCLRQGGLGFSPAYMAAALLEHAELTRQLLELFHLRFDPARAWSDSDWPGSQGRALAEAAAVDRLDAAIDAVASLDHDRILRAARDLVLATVRTNFHQRDDAGRPRPCLALKLDPALLPHLPAPRPRHEIFVDGPRVEGVHLRAGDVARGGIRWSDRLEDYRTEVLDLMRTQVVKNALIVPTGAKGGFVCRRLRPGGPPAGGEVAACYRLFVNALLDVTDNLVDGRVVPPPDTVLHDGPDPYLVVAADKGTAAFSDLANELAEGRGFWLGDAFASGGRTGYDHKALGITARGAWEAVRRHFDELGLDPERDPLAVVGVGDMSGDVFGNGLLASRSLRLIAAFDHRHVFLDPDPPDPPAAWAERRRLFELPDSSWDDYDRSLISAGGGVYRRDAKSVPVSRQARAALGLPEPVGQTALELTPAALVSAILAAPVDLLWNGGIGCFVKASSETNAEVGDRANDAVRIDAARLRCKVVAEGGNLGLTQLARVEFARGGGRVTSDFVDNAAGVHTSDREVNLKVLLEAPVRAGELTVRQRNELLAEAADAVADQVLAAQRSQGRALTDAEAAGVELLDVYERQLDALAAHGLDRELWRLPDAAELAARRAAGEGLYAPELALLLAYAKIALQEELTEHAALAAPGPEPADSSDSAESPAFADALASYFPPTLAERFPRAAAEHPLRGQIVATELANRALDGGGPSLVFRLCEETGASSADAVAAHQAAWEILGLDALWEDIHDAAPGPLQAALRKEARLAAERSARWLLHSGLAHDGPAPLRRRAVEAFGQGVAEIARRLPEWCGADRAAELADAVERWRRDGAPSALARRIAPLGSLSAALAMVELANTLGCPLELTARVAFALDEQLGLDDLRRRVIELPRDDRWAGLARSALRDDLARESGRLWAQVLEAAEAGRSGAAGAGAGAGAEAAAGELVAAWAARRAEALLRWRRVEAELDDPTELAQLCVALAELRRLAG
ncbi:MAG: NAD-glutamate dehydrogenase domain-containing protein, partial [Acidimicrobiales bacterium]